MTDEHEEALTRAHVERLSDRQDLPHPATSSDAASVAFKKYLAARENYGQFERRSPARRALRRRILAIPVTS